jgi:two-component system sensor histidine kinase DesK
VNDVSTAEWDPDHRLTLGERLRAPGVRAWYIGGSAGLVWQAILVVTVFFLDISVIRKVAGLVLLAVLYGGFMVLGPLVWREPTRVKLLAITGYWGLSFLLFPLIGSSAMWVWLMVVSLAAFTNLPLRLAIGASGLVVVVQVLIGAAVHFELGAAFSPLVTAVTGATLIGLGQISKSNRALVIAHDEIARLAVVEERARFGRDLHDVLGHSLTVVTVKSELARRLVKLDPDRAESEIADIERLAREALADLRLAVTNYREIALDSELIAADTALSAAGITAHLPVLVDPVDPALQGTFAWVLREGVTNVIRHSGARECWVTVEVDSVTIADDGRGCGDSPAGNGLRGLRERAAETGAEVLVDRSAHGGFELTARRAT